MKKIETWLDPINIFEILWEGVRDSELSDKDLGFIGGVIKEYRPQRILEIGVAAGGTSLFILNCINELDYKCKMYSVDIASEFHLDPSKKCGYQIERGKNYFNDNIEHHLLLGKPIPYIIDDIKNDCGEIDLLILDTTHYMPGELLDFLICMPYLSKNAVVIMDDLDFAYRGENVQGFATRVLYSTICGERLYSENPLIDKMAGFVMNNDIRKNMDSLFSGLMVPWYYSLDDDLDEYKRVINNNYPDGYSRYFEQISTLGEECARRNIKKEIERLMKYCEMNKDIYIYGAGKRGSALNYFLKDRGYEVKGFVVSDDRIDEISNHDAIRLSDLDINNEYNLFLAVANEEAKNNLLKKGIGYLDIPNYVFPFLKDYFKYLSI